MYCSLSIKRPAGQDRVSPGIWFVEPVGIEMDSLCHVLDTVFGSTKKWKKEFLQEGVARNFQSHPMLTT